MKRSVFLAVACSTFALIQRGAPEAQQVNAFPQREDPLHVRARLFDELMRGNHWNEGTMMPHIIFPPVGTERPLVGNQEDAADHTSMMLSAYSFQYAATKDSKARAYADACMDGLLRLEAVTGVPGWVARSLNRVDEPLWHEQVYFFPMEWHASISMPGYRWQGDLSSDKFVNLCCALSIYHDLCADTEHQEMAAGLVDRFVGRVVDHNFRMVDVDNKMTLWGNFCPDLPHEPLNSLEILGGLRAAYHMTHDGRYLDAYRRLIEQHHYDDDAIMAKILWPERWKTPWDDHLAAKSLYPLMRYESDRSLLNKYGMSLNRHWYDWKNRSCEDPGHAFLAMLYQVLSGVEVFDDQRKEQVKKMWGFDRRRSTFTIPTPDGPKTMEAEEEGSATAFLYAYWFGRYYGILEPEW